MDDDRLATVKRTISRTPSRRDVLRGLAAIGIGWGTTRLPASVAVATSYGCRKVGDRCKRASQCCSGICTGKRHRKKCRAHGTGTCDQHVGGICDAANPVQLICNNSIPGSAETCVCVRTTAGSSFCGLNNNTVSGCAECQSDADCEQQGFPTGSACAPFTNGICSGSCVSGMVCMAPCGTKPTAVQRREQADTTSSSTSRQQHPSAVPLLPVPEKTTRDHD